jgi:hypothetical protein
VVVVGAGLVSDCLGTSGEGFVWLGVGVTTGVELVDAWPDREGEGVVCVEVDEGISGPLGSVEDGGT